MSKTVEHVKIFTLYPLSYFQTDKYTLKLLTSGKIGIQF